MEIEFVSKNISDVLTPGQIEDLQTLQAMPELSKAFSTGWIAGGFARHMLLGGRIQTYFQHDKFWVDDGNHGDLDFFFSDESTANVAASHTNLLSSGRMRFAHSINARSTSGLRFKVQFVNHPTLCKPTLEDTIKQFDFLNCMVGIEGDTITYPVGWREAEDARRLKIVSGHSPFLGGRILKYLNHRGFEGITNDSLQVLKEWFASVAGSKFNPELYKHIDEKYFQNSVDGLQNAGLVNKEDLVFFINRWKIIHHEMSYGHSTTIVTHDDWALSRMTGDAA